MIRNKLNLNKDKKEEDKKDSKSKTPTVFLLFIALGTITMIGYEMFKKQQKKEVLKEGELVICNIINSEYGKFTPKINFYFIYKNDTIYDQNELKGIDLNKKYVGKYLKGKGAFICSNCEAIENSFEKDAIDSLFLDCIANCKN